MRHENDTAQRPINVDQVSRCGTKTTHVCSWRTQDRLTRPISQLLRPRETVGGCCGRFLPRPSFGASRAARSCFSTLATPPQSSLRNSSGHQHLHVDPAVVQATSIGQPQGAASCLVRSTPNRLESEQASRITASIRNSSTFFDCMRCMCWQCR